MMNSDSGASTANVLNGLIAGLLSQRELHGDLGDALQSVRHSHLARLLHYRVAQLEHDCERKACSQAIHALSEHAARRLLRAPALCQALRMGCNADRLLTLIESEIALDAGQIKACWSALGDIWLDAAPPVRVHSLQMQAGRWRAPWLRCGLTLDLSLPARLEHPSANLHEPGIPGVARTLANLALLNRAAELLQDALPSAHTLLQKLGGSIVLRSDDARPDDCWGASSELAVGRMVLVNVTAAASTALCAEMLLRELTHFALDCAELEYPLMRKPDALAEVSMPSPWTGVPLGLHAFLHTCAVSTVLADFWSRVEHLNAEEQERQSAIRRGFKNLHPQCLKPYRSGLSPTAHNLVSKALAV